MEVRPYRSWSRSILTTRFQSLGASSAWCGDLSACSCSPGCLFLYTTSFPSRCPQRERVSVRVWVGVEQRTCSQTIGGASMNRYAFSIVLVLLLLGFIPEPADGQVGRGKFGV